MRGPFTSLARARQQEPYLAEYTQTYLSKNLARSMGMPSYLADGRHVAIKHIGSSLFFVLGKNSMKTEVV